MGRTADAAARAPAAAEEKGIPAALTDDEETDYILTRLHKGLLSSNRCARHGFALALTQVLRRFGGLSTARVLGYAEKIIVKSSANNRQEKREYALARLMFAQVLCRSGRLSGVTAQKLSSMSLEIASFGSAKELRELAGLTLSHMLEVSRDSSSRRTVVVSAIKGLVEAKGIPLNSDTLYLGLRIAETCAEDGKGKKRTRKGTDGVPKAIVSILQQKNVAQLVTVLTEGVQQSCCPHPVWGVLVKALSSDVKGRTSLGMLWLKLSEEHFFHKGGTVAQRRQGFKAFVTLLGRISRDGAGWTDRLLTPGLRRALIANLPQTGRNLSIPAQEASRALSEAAKADPRVASSAIRWLTRSDEKDDGGETEEAEMKQAAGGNAAVAQLISSLVGNIDAETARAHVGTLSELIEDCERKQRAAQKELDRNEKEAKMKAVDKQLLLVAGQLEALAGNRSVRESAGNKDGTENDVLRMLTAYSFYRPQGKKKKNKAGGIKGGDGTALVPAVSMTDAVRSQFSMRVFSVASDRLPKVGGKRHGTKRGRTAEAASGIGAAAPLEEKIDLEGERWTRSVLAIASEVESKHGLILAGEGITKAERIEATNLQNRVLSLSERLLSLIEGAVQDAEVAGKLTVLLRVLLQLGLLQLKSPKETISLLQDFILCTEHVVNIAEEGVGTVETEKKGKKKKQKIKKDDRRKVKGQQAMNAKIFAEKAAPHLVSPYHATQFNFCN